MSEPGRIDPVTLEIVRNALTGIAQQMGVIIWRSAHSTVVREILDFSTGVFDSAGRMTAQSSAIPIQLLSLGPPLKRVLRHFPDLRPGDVILTNDPYLADAQHLPDFTMFHPVFFGGRCVAIVGDMAHQIDCGGRSPGSYGGDVTEIYQEGIRIPPVKILDRGKLNQAVEDMLAANSREPEKLLGDVRAQMAALEVGEREYQKLCARFGPETLGACTEELLAYSERRMREEIRGVPDGKYCFEQFIDDDGITDEPVPLRVALTVKEDEITADFSGTASQRKGSVNATLAMTRATVQYVLGAVLDPDIPQNEGCFRPVHLIAPDASVINARSPAAVVSRVLPCHRMADLLLGALAQALPDRVVAGYYGNSNIYSIGGLNSRTGRHWVSFEIEVGGWGARPNKDGLDGYSAHIHNVQNTPIEMVEASFPLRIERYEFIPDSGGRGKFRGGRGLRRDIRILAEEAVVTALGDRFKFPAHGLFGGEPGRRGEWVLVRDNQETSLPCKITEFPLKKGDVFSVRTQGGGGYGAPIPE
jgi:N-methylhydantoinase B